MAAIREELEIQDRFSQSFRTFISLGERVAASLDRIDNNLGQYTQAQDRAREHTRRTTDTVRNNNNEFGKLAATVGKVAAALGGIATVKAVVGLADEMTQTQARLDAINDGLQSATELNNMIFRSAQDSRGVYTAMAQTVGQLGAQASDVFNSTAETVRFTELLNKQFALSGVNASGVASTMYNLTQALSTGVLRGNDLQMILSNSPALIKRVADYMGITLGELRELAPKGKVTADIVKNAIMGAGEEIDAQFAKMPITFGQAMQMVKNYGLRAFEPLRAAISQAVNSDDFRQAMQIMGDAIVVATNLGIKGFNMMGKAIQWAKDNANVIIPVLGVIVGSLTAYNAIMAISTGLSVAHAAIMAVVTGAKTAYSLAVAFATGNQIAFNAALQACPIVWVIDAIIAAIAVVAALITVFHNLADTGHTVFGDIAGVAIGCLNAIQNGLAMLANVFIGAAEFIANAWNTGIYNIQMAFFNFVLAVANGLNNIISAIDQAVTAIVNAWNTGIYNIQMAIYNFVVSTANGFNSVIDAADGAATALANAFVSGANIAIGAVNGIIEALNKIPGVSIGTIGKIGNVGSVISSRINVGAIKAPTAPQNVDSVISARIDTSRMTAPQAPETVNFGRFETTSMSDAFSKGYEQGASWGDSVQNNIGDKLSGIWNSLTNIEGLTEGGGNLGDLASANNNLADAIGGGSGGSGGGRNVGTVDRVKKIDKCKLSDEDIKIYRDLAERRYMNNIELQTLAPNITVTIPEGQATNLSAEDVANKIKTMLIEQAAAHTAISHAN